MSRLILALLLAAAALPAVAADIRVIAPNAVKEPILEIVAMYEKATGHKVTMAWGGTESITKRVGEGEVFEVVVNAAQNIDALSRSGRLAQGSRTDFARSSVGVAVRAGLPRPDVSSAEGLKRALLQANSIAISSGTSGRFLEQLFQRLGVAEQVRGKLRQPPSGAQIGEMLARRDADIGFQQVSELLHARGIDYIGPLPADMQSITVYSGGLHATAGGNEAARSFLGMLNAPASAAFIRKAGLDPT